MRVAVAWLAFVALTAGACSTQLASPSPSPEPILSMVPTLAPTPGPTALDTPEPSPAARLTAHVAVPAGWDTVVMTKAGLDAAIDKVSASMPLQAAQFAGIEAAGSYDKFLFYAVDYAGSAAVGAANLTSLPLNGATLDSAVTELEAEVAKVGATGTKVTNETLLGVEATVVEFHLTLAKVVYTSRVYLIPDSGSVYEFAATCSGKAATTCLADAHAMVKGMTVRYETGAPCVDAWPSSQAAAILVLPVVDTENNVRLSLPAEWRRLIAGDDGWVALYGGHDSRVEADVLAGRIDIFAAPLEPRDCDLDVNLAVYIRPSGGETVDQLADGYVQILVAAGLSTPRREAVTLTDGPAIRVTADRPRTAGTYAQDRLVTYILPCGGQACYLDFVSSAASAERYASVFLAIARSFEATGP